MISSWSRIAIRIHQASASITATPEARSAIEDLLGLNRLAGLDEIAKSALHLASDASRFKTGTALFVDGGISINRA